MLTVKTGRYNNYMATVVSGFENILENEILSILKIDEVFHKDRGKVYFAFRGNTDMMEQIRCADNIYCVIDEMPVGNHKDDLKTLMMNIRMLNWSNIFRAFVDKQEPAIIISASRKGKQNYSRFDIEDVIKEALLEKKVVYEGTSKEHDIALRVDVANKTCKISIQLTSADFRFRGNIYSFSKGSIRPTIAAALIRISKPNNTDVFYDPFCGSGTITMERSKYPARRILSSDINEEVVTLARKNLDNSVIIYRCDATKTPVKNESVDIIVSNPPWGKQVEVENVNNLYIAFLKECRRILKKEGRIYLLTDCREELINAASKTGFSIDVLYNISLHGLRPDVFYLKESNNHYSLA